MPETAAITRRRDSVPRVSRASLNLLQLARVGRRVMRIEPYFEGQRLVAGRANFHVMRSRFDVETLEDPVEVVNDPGEIAVHEDRGVSRLDLQMKRRLL